MPKPVPVAETPAAQQGTKLFTSETRGVSFTYPDTYFVRDDEKGIVVSPMSFEDKRQASADAIASNLTIAAHPKSYLKDISITAAKGTDVKQEEMLFNGHPAVLYYYAGDRAGEKIYTLFMEYSQSAEKTTLVEAHYTSTLESTYKTILESLVVKE
jgi:hypothetical protein